MAKKGKKKSKPAAQYVVASKVKDAIKSKGFRTAGDAVEDLNEMVDWMIERAVARCEANNRQTVRGTDF